MGGNDLNSTDVETTNDVCSPRTATPILPELVDLIIDHCHSDNRILAAYSLTRNALAFCEFLESSSTTIQPFVRNLRILWNHGTTSQFDKVIPRLKGLCAVTTLRLSLGHQRLSVETWTALQSNFRMLVKLDMFIFLFNTFSDCVFVVCSFPFLEILVLAGEWHTPSLPSPGKYILPRRLHTLDISRSVLMLQWILSQDPVPVVSTLHLRFISYYADIGKYLKTIGSSLYHLTLDFTPDFGLLLPQRLEDEDEVILHFSRHVDLIHNTELRFIHVESNFVKGVELVIAIFSQIHTPHFEEFRFHVRSDHLSNHPWAVLDRVAMRTQLSCLRAVRIDVYSGMTGFVRGRLPACDGRGILQFCAKR